MKLAHLVLAACVALALYIVSCVPKDDSPIHLPKLDSSRVVNGSGVIASNVDSDSILIDSLQVLNRYEVQTAGDQQTRFCGRAKDSTENYTYRISFYFLPDGASHAKRIASFRISRTSSYNFIYDAPADGTIFMVVEEQQGNGWVNLVLTSPAETDEECCGGQQQTTMFARESVDSGGGNGKGSTGDGEQ
jgi:hypothetical protein